MPDTASVLLNLAYQHATYTCMMKCIFDKNSNPGEKPLAGSRMNGFMLFNICFLVSIIFKHAIKLASLDSSGIQEIVHFLSSHCLTLNIKLHEHILAYNSIRFFHNSSRIYYVLYCFV